MKTYTVQCGYAAYYANTVTVTAASLEEALAAAIAQTNDDASWKSLDHCGDTFVDAVAEGEDADPWGDGTLTVPDRFTEAALHASLESDKGTTPPTEARATDPEGLPCGR